MVIDVSESVAKLTLRGFWSALPPAGRWTLSTTAFQTIGRGMTLPFTIVYLNEVRGVPLGQAGTLLSIVAVVALLVTGPSGVLTDRWGARRLLIIGTTAAALGPVVLGVNSTIPWFVVGFVLLGVSFGVSWAAWNTLIATIVTGSLRQQFYGVNFALVNLGVGLGGVIAGLWVDVHAAGTFTTIFLIDGGCMLIPLTLLLGPLRHLDGRPDPLTEGAAGAPAVRSYRAVLQNPTVLWLTGLTFVLTLVGYGQMEAGFQAWARQVSQTSTRALGFAFTVNTLVIVLLQFVVMSRVTGRRRTRVLTVLAAVWALAWSLLAATGLAPATQLATLGVLGFAGVFGLGEIMMQSTIPAMVNDLADDHTRGRANALNAGAFQVGAIVGPIVAGFLLQHQLRSQFIGLLLLGCGVLAISALAIERRITPMANGLVEAGAETKADGGVRLSSG